MKDLNAAADTFKEKSFAAKGIRKTDIPEIMEQPVEGYRKGVTKNIRTGQMMNTAKNFTNNVARPFASGMSIITTLGDVAQYAEEERQGRQNVKPRDKSGGPNAEISAKGSPLRVLPKLTKDNPEDVARARFDYERLNKANADSDKYDIPLRDLAPAKKGKGPSDKYRRDLTPAEERKIEQQAKTDMRRMAGEGNSFWAQRLKELDA